MMNHKSLIALHGFLGKPTDWNFFPFPDLAAVDLFSFRHWKNLWEWADQLNHHFSCSALSCPVLMGYSLGGRLALHALIRNPYFWKGAIIISAHPGLINPQDKEKRFAADLEWANRFRNEEWDSLIQSWNGHGVLADEKFQFKRLELDYSRLDLAYVLEAASLGQQEELREKISQLTIPILWIVGEQDHVYAQLARSIQLSHPQSQLWIVPNAGHRVPWQCSTEFINIVNQFLEKMGE
jgi:2-succinyl-6-hydroxy-2,4-cyclohexadiene-1-carboxylate synthase